MTVQSHASIRAVSMLIGPTQSVHANPSSSVDGRRSFNALQVRHVFRGRGDRDVWFHSAFDRTQPRPLVPAQQFAEPVRPP